MINRTAVIGLYLLSQNQAQKEILVNENFNLLEQLWSLSIEEININTPPQSPDYGAGYIIGSSPENEWEAHTGCIAIFLDRWHYIEPKEGMIFWLKSDVKLVVYTSKEWKSLDCRPGEIKKVEDNNTT